MLSGLRKRGLILYGNGLNETTRLVFEKKKEKTVRYYRVIVLILVNIVSGWDIEEHELI